MDFDVLVPARPGEIPFYVRMFERQIGAAVVATDGAGGQHTGALVAVAVDPAGVLVTLARAETSAGRT